MDNVMLRALKHNLITFVSYLVVALIGYWFLSPFSLVLVGLLPAGVIMALLLIFSLRVLPAIYVGALCISLFMYSGGLVSFDHQVLIFSSMVALGPVLQGWIGYLLIEKLIGVDTALTKPQHIILFILIVGLCSALIAPTWSLLMMELWRSMYVLSPMLDWFFWCFINSISLIVLTPAVLIIGRYRLGKLWRSRCFIIALPLVLMMAFILSLVHVTLKVEYQGIKGSLGRLILENEQAVIRQIQSAEFIARSLKSYYSASQEVTAQEFKTYAQALLHRNDNVFAVTWLVNKMPSNVGVSPIYQSNHLYLQPSYIGKIKAGILKKDILNHVQSMRLKGSGLFLSSPYYLNTANKMLAIMYVNPADSEMHLQGVGVVAIDVTRLLKNNFKLMNSVYRVKVDDVTQAGKAVVLFDKKSAKALGVSSRPVTIEKMFKVGLGDRVWRIKATASHQFMIENYNWVSWFVLFSSQVLSLLATALLLILYGQKNEVDLKVKRQTQRLRKEMDKNSLVLSSAGEGIVGLNKAGKITFANKAALDLLQYHECEILNKDFYSLIQPIDKTSSKRPSDLLDVHKTIQDGKVRKVDNDVLLKSNKDLLWVDLTITPIQVDQVIDGAVVVFSDVTQRLEAKSQLHHMRQSDLLTDLPNRDSFFQHVDQIIKNSKFSNNKFVVCYIDIDDFKQINDNMGHDTGDLLIKYVGDQLKSATPKGGYVARLGGDEFGIVIESLHNIESLVSSYLKLFDKVVHLNDHDINTSISIGIAAHPAAGSTATSLMKSADVAMYRAKNSGKNAYAFFDESMEVAVSHYHAIQTSLHEAVNNKSFTLVYQPIMRASGGVAGFEVLMRWPNQAGMQSTPDEFIPIAEESGLIHAMGDWSIKRMSADFKMLSSISSDFFVSINISVKQFEKSDFIEKITRELKSQGVDKERVVLEVTETALMREPESSIQIMQQLSKLGFKFALDDFGTGYSSMNYLRRLPINHIKIDKSFVDGMFENKHDAAIVDATISLARSLDLKVIAEGVETEEQKAHLIKVGCQYLQGYLFSKPVPLAELVKMLNKRKDDAK